MRSGMAGADGGLCRVGSDCDAGCGARVALLHQGLRFRRRVPAIAVFRRLAQCQASASGRDATCAANPYFNAKADMQTDRSRQSRKEILMRILALAILAIGAVSAAAPAQAQTYDPELSGLPACLWPESPITSAPIPSLPQCNASASGRSAQCVINPYFAHASQVPSATRGYKRLLSSELLSAGSCRAIPVRRPGRRPATPAGPSGRRVPYCGWRSASRPASPSPAASAP